MIRPLDRRRAVQLIETALAQGVSLEKASRLLGICARTYQRRTREGDVPDDGRPLAKRPPPTNRLSDGEREQILALCNRPEYSHLPPSQILPMLAVTGKYMASESSFPGYCRKPGRPSVGAVPGYRNAAPNLRPTARPDPSRSGAGTLPSWSARWPTGSIGSTW